MDQDYFVFDEIGVEPHLLSTLIDEQRVRDFHAGERHLDASRLCRLLLRGKTQKNQNNNCSLSHKAVSLHQLLGRPRRAAPTIAFTLKNLTRCRRSGRSRSTTNYRRTSERCNKARCPIL